MKMKQVSFSMDIYAPTKIYYTNSWHFHPQTIYYTNSWHFHLHKQYIIHTGGISPTNNIFITQTVGISTHTKYEQYTSFIYKLMDRLHRRLYSPFCVTSPSCLYTHCSGELTDIHTPHPGPVQRYPTFPPCVGTPWWGRGWYRAEQHH